MEQNLIHTSPEAAPRAFPSNPVPSEVEAGPRARRCRHDGWTPERQIAFLEALAACGVVTDACRHAGLSAQSAYAFRNRRAGRAFATAWDAVLVHRARGRLSDELMSRAMNGCVEAIRQAGEVTAERHRFDNRLSMAVLTRLDRLADKQGEREGLLRAVSEDLDDFFDCVEAGGDAEAFVEARRPRPEPEEAPGPADADGPPPPPIEDEWDRMASLKGCLDYKVMNPADIDISDLPGPGLAGCNMDQILRAHYSGYLGWLEIRRSGAADEDADDFLWRNKRELSPKAYMKKLQAHCRAAEPGPQPPAAAAPGHRAAAGVRRPTVRRRRGGTA
jgi:hypothetical protein